MTIKSWIYLLAGPLALLVMSGLTIDGLSQQAVMVCGVVLWMIIWWISEAVPLPVTSLLPMLLFPLLKISSAEAATAPYAHPIIFLFFGGFCLSIAMEKTGLHQQIAIRALRLVGPKAEAQLAAIMAVTAFLSMWMSNTATAVMMLPIALSLVAMAEPQYRQAFTPALLLGVAYAASIGGISTIIGTPPNALLIAYLQKTYQINIGFGQWMVLALPLAVLMLVLSWLWLSRWQFRLNRIAAPTVLASTPGEKLTVGPVTLRQHRVAQIFTVTALCWIFQPLLSSWTGLALTDTVIALAGAMALFILPVEGKPVLHWADSDKLPWGVLLLFGGGLSMAAQIQQTGVSDYLAQQFHGLSGVSPVLIILAVVGLIIFLTEVTSNVAVAATFLPLLGPVALSLGLSPLYLTVPAALAASMAFMLPVATPPNAIVFANGQLKISEMVRAGFALNLIGILLITVLCQWLLPLWL